MAYEVRYRDPARRERLRTFPRGIDAERFASTIDTDIVRGQYVDPVLGRTSFAEFLTRVACNNGASQAQDSGGLSRAFFGPISCLPSVISQSRRQTG